MKKITQYRDTGREALSTRAKLLLAGKEEFFQKGYQAASLRRICAACGVTTGAFYFLFSCKDALFCEIADPFINRWKALSDRLAFKEMNDLSTGPSNDRELMTFLLGFREELLILMEKSAGSSREAFSSLIFETLTGFFTETFFQNSGQKPDSEAIKLLVYIRIQGIMYILKGDYTMEQALFLNDTLARHSDAGFRKLIENSKTMF